MGGPASSWRVGTPSNTKGRAVEEHVRANNPGHGQQIQFALDIDVVSNRKATGHCQTWILLYRHDTAQRASFAELSLPLEIAGGKVTRWGDRAIIEIPELFPEPAGRTTDVSAFDDVDFEIRAAGEG